MSSQARSEISRDEEGGVSRRGKAESEDCKSWAGENCLQDFHTNKKESFRDCDLQEYKRTVDVCLMKANRRKRLLRCSAFRKQMGMTFLVANHFTAAGCEGSKGIGD